MCGIMRFYSKIPTVFQEDWLTLNNLLNRDDIIQMQDLF